MLLLSAALLGVAPAPSAASWPPVGAEAQYRWRDGISSGPLGARVDGLLQTRFRLALEAEARVAPEALGSGFEGVIGVSRELAGRQASGQAARDASRRVLLSLFPDWPPGSPVGRVGLLHWFGVFFARPFPAFSAKLNAWVTWWAAQWLIGPCTLQALDTAELARFGVVGVAAPEMVGDGVGQQLLVHRCRFLEESGCASVCVNCCKMPTQDFFNADMGVPMRMLPDYETLECRLQFGVAPSPEDEAQARSVPCFASCASANVLRQPRAQAAALEQCVRMY